MKKTLILNGSPRRNGKTASLVRAFIEGTESTGNEVAELNLDGMDIASCKACEACEACVKNGGVPAHERRGACVEALRPADAA